MSSVRLSPVRTAARAASRPPRRRGRLGLGIVGLLAGLAFSVAFAPWPRLDVAGPAQGAMLNAEDLSEVVFAADAPGAANLAGATLRLDGQDVTARLRRTESGVAFSPEELADGDHRLRLTVPRRLIQRPLSHEWTFSVDTTAPDLRVTPQTDPVIAGEPTAITGTVDAGVELTVNGRPTAVSDGTFSIEVARPGVRPLRLVATDAAGNVTAKRVDLAVIPSRVTVDEVRAVHVSFYGWASSLREPVLAMAERGQINTVQLDLKDESGMVGYDSAVPLARRIGASAAIFDLDEAVKELHDRGIHVVGRLVAFRDPVLAAAAWESGDRRMVLQTPDGLPYAGYGGFTNFANRRVRQYNIDIAKEAAAAGVDGILYDYVRRPDGDLRNLVIPGMKGTPERAVAQFVALSHKQLRPYGVEHGASVYGIAATRPTEIAQDVPAIARYVDYVAPMVYPSHWAPGEYGVSSPNNEPYQIVRRSLVDFKRAVRGTGARVVPWLQDFSLGVDYGEREVRAQIDAAADAGIEEFLLWDPHVTYTADALDAGRN